MRSAKVVLADTYIYTFVSFHPQYNQHWIHFLISLIYIFEKPKSKTQSSQSHNIIGFERTLCLKPFLVESGDSRKICLLI